MTIVWHRHHIIPKHMGGTDDDSNIIKVNIAMHAFLHKCLFEDYGLWQDEIAWKSLSGQIPNSQINNEIRKLRMLGNDIWVGRKHKEESKQKMGPKKGIKFTEEHKKKLSEKRKVRKTKITTKEKLSQPRPYRRKKYEISYDGTVIDTVLGLKDFCKNNNLTESNLRKTLTGERPHHKKFTAKEIKQ